jgi:hypothetical protein
MKSVKRVLVETDLNSVSLFISRLAASECLFVIMSELESVQVDFELCNRGNNNLYIYLAVRLTPERERERERESSVAKVCVVTYLFVFLYS